MDCELERRGVACASPLRSAPALLDAPKLARAIQRNAARAGGETLTTNTFRTQLHALARVGLAPRAAELTALAAPETGTSAFLR